MITTGTKLSLGSLAKAVLVAAGLIYAAGGTASAATIAFENDYTNDRDVIAADYGSLPHLSVSYQSFNPSGVLQDNHLKFWHGDYSGHPAAFSDYGGNSMGAIIFTPEAGYKVTLSSFFLGGWPNVTKSIAYYVDDLSTAGIDISDNPTVSGTTGLTVTPNLSSATGIVIHFGPDGYNGGINYIDYSVSAVPVPAALPLLGSALGALGLWSRRRKKAA